MQAGFQSDSVKVLIAHTGFQLRNERRKQHRPILDDDDLRLIRRRLSD